jgi:Fe2+ or Zn2+ uptake regulation protein
MKAMRPGDKRREMEESLRAAGFRITRQRASVLNYLAETRSHPSARQILEATRKDCPGISLATVYNTLETLSKLGLIKVLDFQGRDNRHETNTRAHVNLICRVCGKIEDFEEGASVHMGRVKDEFGFEVHDFRLEYYGVCARCRAVGRSE